MAWRRGGHFEGDLPVPEIFLSPSAVAAIAATLDAMRAIERIACRQTDATMDDLFNIVRHALKQPAPAAQEPQPPTAPIDWRLPAAIWAREQGSDRLAALLEQEACASPEGLDCADPTVLPPVQAEPKDGPGTWEENASYLLDRCPYTVRQREGGGPECLISTLIVTFTGMQMRLQKDPMFAKPQQPAPAAQEPATWAIPTDWHRDDFGEPIIYNTHEVEAVAHSLTGDEGEEDALSVLQGLARYVDGIWPGKTALQVLLEFEEPAPAAQEPLTDEALDALRQGSQGLNFVTLREFRLIARAVEAKQGITGAKT